MNTNLSYLQGLVAAAAEACLVRKGQSVNLGDEVVLNQLGLDVLLPSAHGKMGYRAWWLRDFVMSIPALSLSGEYLVHASKVVAESQRQTDWIWHNGRVPAWTPAEHINLDGGCCYFPGSYFADERQGGAWGPCPPMDSALYFVDLVHHAAQRNDGRCLSETVGGVSLFDRARLAFDSVCRHPRTGLAWSPPTRRAVDFGFCDVVHKIGSVLFGSCLVYQAARQLHEMAQAVGAEATPFADAAQQVQAHLQPTFGAPGGWLYAATDVCRQRDVWATAFAVYSGALQGDAREAACLALRDAYLGRTALRDGAVRHLRPEDDWSDESAWQYAAANKDVYQNGGYWLTPAGWCLFAIAQVDRPASNAMLDDIVGHLRETDFRQGGDHGGPYEWHHPEHATFGKAVNLTSICCPLAGARAAGLLS